MIYDVIIIGAGASGLFAGVNLDKNLSKLILEKTDKPGAKVLLSGGERANISNIDIEPERDYFSQNKKFLLSIFSSFNQWDTISFFSSLGINLIEEDRGRLILESGNSKDLLEVLIKGVKNNNCEIKFEQDVVGLQQIPQSQPFPPREKGAEQNVASSLPWGEIERGICLDNLQIFQITTTTSKKYFAKNVIVSSGGKSFFHVGTTGEGFSIAQKLGLNVINPYRTLCGMSTKMDLSSISGASCDVDIVLKDNNPSPLRGTSLSTKGRRNGIIYEEKGPILFTHFGVSGPIIYNLSNAIGEYLNSLKLNAEEFEKYILDNLSIDLKFDLEKTPKKITKFFNFPQNSPQKNISPLSRGMSEGQGDIKGDMQGELTLQLQNWRSWKEAKATGGGIDTLELDNHMQSKKYKNLYFVGELVDVTGKTGGYNLQWAWSSAFVASKNIKK